MKTTLLILTFSISLGAFADQSQDCKSWTKKDWDNYIDTKLLHGNYGNIYEDLEVMKKTCPQNVTENRLTSCLDRISGYYKQLHMPEAGMFSGIMSDKDYLALEPAKAMELPPELEKSPNGLPSNWRDVAKKNGWKYVLFHSNTAGESRLVIFLPGKDQDRMLVYYRFGYHGDGPSNDPSKFDGLQMQAIIKNEKGKTLEHPKYYFRSWGFEGPKNHPEVTSSGGRCVMCHISGPRAIQPQEQPAFKTELGGVANLDEFNKLVVRKEILDYSPYYDLKHFPTHLQVGEKWGCVNCHNGTSRNSLAFSIDGREFLEENVDRKVVREKSMPLGGMHNPSLTSDLRAKMAEDVTKEYSQALNEWLTEVKCAGPSSGSLPRGNPEPRQR